jgi:hypothetical protein
MVGYAPTAMALHKSMNVVAGRIVIAGTDSGVPSLVVAAYDVDAIRRSGGARVDVPDLPNADRLGSAVTSSAGTFSIAYEDTAFRSEGKERRPDLIVVVSGPEHGPDAPPVLHLSQHIRANAGRHEAYSIGVSSEALAAAGIDVDDLSTEPGAIAKRLATLEARRRVVASAGRSVQAAHVSERRERSDKFANGLRTNLIDRLSGVSPELQQDPGYVGIGDSIAAKTRSIIAKGLDRFGTPDTEGPTLRGVVTLTNAQKSALDAARDEDGSVSAETFAQILQSEADATNGTTMEVRHHPSVEVCRRRSPDRECGERALEGDDSDPPPPGNDTADTPDTEPVPPPTQEHLLTHVARLLHHVRSPEEAVASGIDAAADNDAHTDEWSRTTSGVHARLGALNIQPGPADSTAYFEFHDLRIAFEHVWKEAIDEGVLDLAEDAYDEIVELGGDPDVSTLDALVREGRLIHRARRGVAAAGAAAAVTAAGRNRDHRDQTGVGDLMPFLGFERSGRRSERVPASSRHSSFDASFGGGGNVVRDHRDHTLDLLRDLERRIREAYPFTIYAADQKERSINFGVIVTYRQKWEPLGYQAGELVKSVTLAPGEIRKYSTKRTVRTKRSVKEVEKNLSSRSTESQETTRAESEIVRKALTTTNFTLTASGSFDIGIADGEGSSTFSKEASRASDEIKKQFREAVFKAAQEYKQERSVEVTSEDSIDLEASESGEISNANDEIPVTHLFFDLQRRFRVTEQIHRITPVVFVAQEVPAPEEIDEDWLLAHDWILRRVILDDTFLPALTYLSTNMLGDKLALGQLLENLEQQRQVADELKEELVAIRREVTRRYAALDAAVRGQASAIEDEPGTLGRIVDDVLDTGLGAVPVVGAVAGLFGFGGSDGDPEAARVRREAADAAYDQAMREQKSLLGRLEREVTALNDATSAYNGALRKYVNGRTQIARLRTHIKQNILYYMQAIWLHEPPDQRFFRLHQVPVPTLESSHRRYFVDASADTAIMSGAPHRRLPRNDDQVALPYRFGTNARFVTEFEEEPLSKVANLDRPLGFKGNYAIFPMHESNDLTDFMMAPYIDKGFASVVDPDELGNWTLDEFAKYVCCLKEQLDADVFEELREDLRAQYERLLRAPHRQGEVITVPTGSLFIDSLPGVHPVLEPFKLMHRAVDVKRAQAETRTIELENLRRGARLVAGQLEDADIDKKIVVEGNVGPVAVPLPDTDA